MHKGRRDRGYFLANCISECNGSSLFLKNIQQNQGYPQPFNYPSTFRNNLGQVL